MYRCEDDMMLDTKNVVRCFDPGDRAKRGYNAWLKTAEQRANC
jgi:hypothetical protein